MYMYVCMHVIDCYWIKLGYFAYILVIAFAFFSVLQNLPPFFPPPKRVSLF